MKIFIYFSKDEDADLFGRTSSNKNDQAIKNMSEFSELSILRKNLMLNELNNKFIKL
jgi:hypothetical protein